ELLRVIEASPKRVTAPCRHFGPGSDRRCGGCEWLHLDYPLQLAAKERAFLGVLRHTGKLDLRAVEVRGALASPSPLRYRCRAKFHVEPESGRLAFLRRRSHERVALAECHLLEPGLDALRESAGQALRSAHLTPREIALEWSSREGRGSAALWLD